MMTAPSEMKAEGFTLVERSPECFALLRDDAPVWIVEYEAVEFVRPVLWYVYRACVKVKNPAAPWSSNNLRINGDFGGNNPGFTRFEDAVKAARDWSGNIRG